MLCMSRREGGQGRARRQQIRGGTAGPLAPRAQPGSEPRNWKPGPPPPSSTRQGRLLLTHFQHRPRTSTPGPALRYWRACSRTSKAGGCAQEAAAGAVLEPQSGGREGAAGTCIVRAPLPAGPPGTPGARSWRRLLGRPAGCQAGSNWAEGTRAALSFIYICIHQLLSCGRSRSAETVRDPNNSPSSWLCGQVAGLESGLLHLLAV